MLAASQKEQPQKSQLSRGSLLGDELLDEIGNLNDVVAPRGSCGKQRWRLNLLQPNLPALPNPGVIAKGTDQPRVAPRVNRQHFRTNGRGDLHRTAIHADDKIGRAEKPNHLSDRGLVEQIYCISGQFSLKRSDSCQYRCERPDAIAELRNVFGREGLPFASRKRMQNNKRLVAKRRIQGKARRKRKDGLFDFRKAQAFENPEITQDGMLIANYWHYLVVEPCRALARVADANSAPGATQPGHQRAAEEALQIQSNVGTNLTQLKRPRNRSQHSGHSAKPFAWKEHYLVDNGIVPEHRLPTFVHEPDDFGFRVKVLECSCTRESMNDVA